jgi:hypothetical protein
MVADADLHVSLQKFGSGVYGAHVRIEMGRLKSHGPGAVELGGDLGRDFVRGTVSGDVGDGWPEVSGAVDKAGDNSTAGYRAPAIVIPFGREGKVKARVDVGVGFQPFHKTRDPGAGHHDADGSSRTFSECGNGAFIGFQGHTGVVDVEDEDAGALWEAEAICVGDLGGGGGGALCWILSGKQERQEKQQKQANRSNDGIFHCVNLAKIPVLCGARVWLIPYGGF